MTTPIDLNEAALAEELRNQPFKVEAAHAQAIIHKHLTALSEQWEKRHKEEWDTVDRVWKAMGITTYEQAKPLAVFEHVAKLKLEHSAYRQAAERYLEICGERTAEIGKLRTERDQLLKLVADEQKNSAELCACMRAASAQLRTLEAERDQLAGQLEQLRVAHTKSRIDLTHSEILVKEHRNQIASLRAELAKGTQ